MFFISGFSTLVFQTAWNKILTQVIGVDYFSSVIIISIFMLGLGLGGYFGGRLTGKANSIWFFVVAEILISIFAFFSDSILRNSQEFVVLTARGDIGLVSLFLNFGIYLCILIIPTICMGISLPLLVHFFRRNLAAGQALGSLYSINILGAFFGCFITGFVFIGLFGIKNTIYGTALLNLFSIFLLAFLFIISGAKHLPESFPRIKQKIKNSYDLFFLMFTIGFISLAFEVLYFRILIIYLSASAYVFPMLLSVYLVHLSIGNILASRMIVIGISTDKIIGISIFGSLLTIPIIFILPDLFDTVGFLDPKSGSFGFLGVVSPTKTLIFCFACVLFALTPVTFISMLFPAIIQVITKNKDELGRNVGSLYLFMTIGNFFGALIVGMVMLPIVGLIITTLILMGLISSLPLFINRGKNQLVLISKNSLNHRHVIGFFILIFACNYFFINKTFYEKIVFLGIPPSKVIEQLEGTVFIYDHDDDRQLTKNNENKFKGITISLGSEPVAKIYRDESQMPIWPVDAVSTILGYDPKRFLLIGVGSGSQALALRRLYPNCEFVIVELVDAIIQELKESGGPLTKDLISNAEIYTMDGGRFIRTKASQKNFKKFDVIQIGIFHITVSGAGNLFTKEFLSEAKKLLNPGGLISSHAYLNAVKAGTKVFESVYVFGNDDEDRIAAEAIFTDQNELSEANLKSRHEKTTKDILYKLNKDEWESLNTKINYKT